VIELQLHARARCWRYHRALLVLEALRYRRVLIHLVLELGVVLDRSSYESRGEAQVVGCLVRPIPNG